MLGTVASVADLSSELSRTLNVHLHVGGILSQKVCVRPRPLCLNTHRHRYTLTHKHSLPELFCCAKV